MRERNNSHSKATVRFSSAHRRQSRAMLFLERILLHRAHRAVVKRPPAKAAGRFLLADTAKKTGGESGIRTHGTLLTYTRFPSVRLKPLGHLSAEPDSSLPGPAGSRGLHSLL